MDSGVQITWNIVSGMSRAGEASTWQESVYNMEAYSEKLIRTHF